MPVISIIIPFHNVENYIEQCLDSVQNQSLQDIEVILINDASTDKSKEIAQKYIANDKRFKIINLKKRKGQGYARNRGIKAAHGKYIGFVDSDDFIEKNMFEALYNSAVNNDTDISMCQVREYDDLNEKYINSDYYSLAVLDKLGDDIFSAEDTINELLDINVALWNKIYKRDFLLATGEKFPEGFIYEDLPFFFGTYLKAEKIQIVWQVLYNYRINRKNSTMMQFNDKILDRLPMVSMSFGKMKTASFFNEIKQKIQGWIINDIFHRYILLNENHHREYFFLMKKAFKNLEIENIDDDYWKHIYHFPGYLLVINNTFEKFNQKVFNKYLDIQEVENRLNYKLKAELDVRLNNIYSNLKEVLFNDIKINVEYQVNSEAEKRFDPIYKDMSKIYKYMEKLFYEFETKISNINKNIQFQNEQNEIYKEETNQLISGIDLRAKERENSIRKSGSQNSNEIEELKKELKTQILKNEELLAITNRLNAVIEEQKKENDAQMQLLTNQIQELSAQLEEKTQSMFKKLFKKKGKRND